MHEFKISPDSTGKDLEEFAISLHNIIKLPLTIRSLNKRGLRIEEGKIVDHDYTGPIMEQALKENRLIRTVPISGAFKGRSVLVAPIHDDEGNAIAAIGISDTYGAIDFMECFCRNPTVITEVEKCGRHLITNNDNKQKAETIEKNEQM